MSDSKSKTTGKNLSSGFVQFNTNSARRASELLPKDAIVEELVPPVLGKDSRPSYAHIKSTFRQDLKMSDRRFVLSQHVSDHLSVEQDELARFEKRVTEELERRIQLIRDQAQEEGYRAGFEAGEKKAYAEEKARLVSAVEKLAVLMDTVKDAKITLAQQYEKALVELGFKLARVIVNREIEERPEAIHFTVKEVLERIGRAEDVRIRLSHKAFEVIDIIKEQIDRMAREGRITFDVDHSLKAGDCIVESMSGEIASIVDEKFEKLKELISKKAEDGSEKKANTGT